MQGNPTAKPYVPRLERFRFRGGHPLTGKSVRALQSDARRNGRGYASEVYVFDPHAHSTRRFCSLSFVCTPRADDCALTRVNSRFSGRSIIGALPDASDARHAFEYHVLQRCYGGWTGFAGWGD